MSVKVRFAPSPTGYLHVGNTRTAFITWLYARHHNGHFLLRIDDTDYERSKIEYELDIKDSLTWLGLNWDETANQKDRTDRYEEQIQILKSKGYIYPCYETSDELALKRKTLLARGKPPIYDRAALDLTAEQIKQFEEKGRKPHWRFKLTHQPIIWNDLIRGEVRFNGEDLSDPVVIREDGRPLYHLCSVIDDIDFNITHIIRGEDHVSNTATHIQMFEALEAKPPECAHLPLLSGMDGGKLSKRLGSLSLRDLRNEEALEPMALNSLLGRLGTSDPIESFHSITPLIESFDFSKFSRSTPKFDEDELWRLNAKILHETSFEDVRVRLANMGLDSLDENFWNTVKPNLNRLSDIHEWWQITQGPIENKPAEDDQDFLKQALDLIPSEPWGKDTWSEWTGKIKAKTGRKGKPLFMPLRLALTGMDHGPELSDLILLLGSEKVRRRLES